MANRHRLERRVAGATGLCRGSEVARVDIGWSTARITERYERDYMRALTEMRALLAELAQTGKLSLGVQKGQGVGGGGVASLAATFQQDRAFQDSVEFDDQGHARILVRLKFNSALGLVAYAILRLSELSTGSRALLACKECGTFKIPRYTRGDRRSDFCSDECSKSYNVSAYRQRAKRAEKARRHK